jgi:hypothetical protein
MTQLKQLLAQIASEHLFIPTLTHRNSDSLDFHMVSVWAVESALRAAFDAGHKSIESEETNVHDLLARRKQIAVLRDVEDMKEVRPDLTKEQARDVLQECQQDLIDFDPRRQPIIIVTVRGGLVEDVHSTAPATVFVEDWDCPPDRPLVMDFESEPLTPEQQLRIEQCLATTNDLKGE